MIGTQATQSQKYLVGVVKGAPGTSVSDTFHNYDMISIHHSPVISSALWIIQLFAAIISLIARFMGPTWGSPGADRTQVGPMLALWTLLSGYKYIDYWMYRKQSPLRGSQLYFGCSSIVIATKFNIWHYIYKQFCFVLFRCDNVISFQCISTWLLIAPMPIKLA